MESTFFENSGVNINKKSSCQRSTVSRTDKHKDNKFRDGFLIQYNLLDQFHDKYSIFSKTYKGPGSLCGYFSCACALLLERFLGQSRTNMFISNSELMAIVQMLSNETVVNLELHVAMTEIQRLRQIFCFENAVVDASKYMRNWVANYEIGDHLRRHSSSNNTHFFRTNEYPFRGDATADHAPRLEAEAVFGGVADDITGVVTYQESDSAYFFQSGFNTAIERERELFYKPESFLRERLGESAFVGDTITSTTSVDERSGQNSTISDGLAAVVVDVPATVRLLPPQVVLLDLAGHFVIGLACQLKLSDAEITNSSQLHVEDVTIIDSVSAVGVEADSSDLILKNVFVVFNTTHGSYLNELVAKVFDTFFP